MAVYVSRKRRVEGGTISPVPVCVELTRSRVRLDFSFYKDSFSNMRCYQGVQCQVEDDDLLFENVLRL